MSGSSITRIALGIAVALATVVFVACGSDDDGTADGAGTAGGDGTVQVTLQEWAVVPDAASAPAGEVTFAIENTGEETHEFVIIRTDLDISELPAAADGSVDEEGSGIEVVDEAEDIASGSSTEVTTDLEPGHYALICNIVEGEGGEHESHYAMGMRAEFTVE